MEITRVLIILALILYAVGALCLLRYLLAGGEALRKTGFALSFVGLVAHLPGTALLVRQTGLPPFANLYGSLAFFSFSLMAVYFLVDRKRIPALNASASLTAAVGLGIAVFIPRDIAGTLLPALQNQWGTIHIAASLIGYGGFVLAFWAAMGYILQERMLKSKHLGEFQKRLPSLDAVDQTAYRMVAVGFPMLTLGIITGALWAQTAWGSYWHWDPKESWALITWLVYAAYLHLRIVQGWRGKWANRLLITGFLCVVVTYFGVNFLAESLHNYNW